MRELDEQSRARRVDMYQASASFSGALHSTHATTALPNDHNQRKLKPAGVDSVRTQHQQR